jgi:beta-glucanase (GH16 family)
MKNCYTRTLLKKMCLILMLCFSAALINAQTLVWEDNFDGPSIDGNKWTYDFGDGCERGLCGWGNSELQYYTSRTDNARVENGNLVIEAKRETFLTREFTSARLKTEGRMHFKYGTLEARIKVPSLANGLWPAYWMLGTTGNWPANGEIDMMEMGSAAAIAAGVANRRAGAAVHWDYQGSQADFGEDYTSPTDLTSGYHIYKLTWDAQYIRVYIDNIEFFDFAISDIAGGSLDEFHIPHYLILNLAVGGSYTGVMSAAGITAPLPGKMEIDYIKLYQNSGSSLYVGSANAQAGTFGVYTETTPVNNALTYGVDANLYLWNNLTPITATPYEGSQVMAYRANAGAWFGLGVATDYKNMSSFSGGNLKFHMKTSSTATFKVGISTAFGDSWINFVNGGQQYGLVRDGNWYEVTIPFSAFYNLDLYSVKQMFMVVADPPSANVDIFIDNIYYSGGAVVNQPPTVSITSPSAGASFALGQAITINATAADANGSVTKVEFLADGIKIGEDTSSPYTFSWSGAAAGNRILTARAIDNGNASTTSSSVSVTVNVAATNLALNKAVTVSSSENTTLSGAAAVDGNASTRWSSAFSDPQWLYVDLGASYAVNRVKITWEAAYGKDYQVQVSSNASSWTTIKTITNNTTLVNDHTGLSGTGRYIRIYGTARGTAYGYSIFELEVYGTPGTTSTVCTGTAANGDYSYEVSTTGGTVNWKFIPLAPIQGSTLAILYVKVGNGGYAGYPMTASGSNFTYSLVQNSGSALTFYYTYRVGNTTTERNSSANPHTYTVGTTCSAGARNAAQEETQPLALESPVEIYPNPVEHELRVKGIQEAPVRITDMTGKEIIQGKLQGGAMEISPLHAGVYIAIIQSKKGMVVKRFIKR